ncbi:SigE family RNA polymerase sigma factor [Catenulispora rubra]|uniref:SigE family RNA polymerase sigma factor n=1 Tax=Catenulispora rubra TaxID=280293 RepID=UPI001892370A|nr:SigE family RNA polymerase sigma factor [Catenulispora rubra]
MAKPDRDAEFTEYLKARSAWLARVGYLLCGDWHRADDLAQNAAVRLYRHWSRASRADSVDAYARRILVNVYLDEQQSGWSRFTFLHRDPIERETPALDADASLDLREALARLAPRQRATVVLRYYCDLSVEEAAEVLGCSPGTVKSQTARALARLRVLLAPRAAIELEGITR